MSALPKDPRELLRGMMRGDRQSMKLGYHGPNAAIAVCDWLVIRDADAVRELVGYAYGFAAALHGRDAPDLAGEIGPRADAVSAGYADGCREDLARTYPGAFPGGR